MINKEKEKVKVLYVEDELFLGKIVKESLESRNFEVYMLHDGLNITGHLNKFEPDICILDVMLPHKDGFTVGTEIREVSEKLPIIYLTAKSQTEDVVKGFHSGGNDYLKKPFSMEELIIRMENILTLTKVKEENAQQDAILDIGKFKFNTKNLELSKGKNIKRLSHKESQLLKILYKHKGKPLDRSKILNKIWGDDDFFKSRNLDVYIRKLREYLKEDTAVQLITLKGVGYLFVID